ncbi:MAG: ABC transporter substrate-binding protein [Oscillospiraceae bacterium]|nr:ABC transporter substrate-binding protein [Oscillospiraceae bacterium]
MKKILCLLLALCMVFAIASCAKTEPNKPEPTPTDPNTPDDNNTPDPAVEPDRSYTIRIYSNSNSPDRVEWFVKKAADAGFTVSIDDNSVISGDSAAVQAANEKQDGDLIFGLNETRWGQIIGGKYENLKLIDWTPTWAGKVGDFKYDGQAYGIVIQNVLMLYRTDEYGTNGAELHFQHWADVVNSGYRWYRQNKVGGTTNANINSAMLYAFVDPTSPAGGISVEGWKTLWKFCAEGVSGGDDFKYGFDPLNRGDVQVSEYYSSALYGQIDAAANGSDHPLKGGLEPENWNLVDIADGTYYIAEYVGILDKAGRTEAQTAQVKAFAEWFGGADMQAAWAEEWDTYPCNSDAASAVYATTPAIYTLPNFARNAVAGTDMNYAEYVAAHSAEWTNILTNLGFYWADNNAPAEPDWDNLDWATLTQKAE